MTREDDFIGQLERYLDEYEGHTPLPDAVRDAIRAELPKTKQVGSLPGPMRSLLPVRTMQRVRDLRIPRRTLPMKQALYGAALIAFLAVAGLAALYAISPRLDVGSGPTPGPTVQQTQAPSPAATAAASPVNLPDGWVAYTSSQYGFTIGHPADWSVRPAERAWELDTDAADWLSPAADDFTAPAGDVRVSAWSVPLDPDQEMGVESQTASWANVAAWAEEYCRAAGTPCEGIIDRAVPLCLERRDCHPGILVPFQDEVRAFFTNGGPGADMVVIAVWRPESHPSVAPFGGARQLLEAFLSTMCVWPEDARPPFEEAIPGC